MTQGWPSITPAPCSPGNRRCVYFGSIVFWKTSDNCSSLLQSIECQQILSLPAKSNHSLATARAAIRSRADLLSLLLSVGWRFACQTRILAPPPRYPPTSHSPPKRESRFRVLSRVRRGQVAKTSCAPPWLPTPYVHDSSAPRLRHFINADCLQVEPLRIHKGTPSSSPVKSGGSLPRALTELGPNEKRRNSPSFNQSTGVSTLDCDAWSLLRLTFRAEDGSQSGLVSIPLITRQCL